MTNDAPVYLRSNQKCMSGVKLPNERVKMVQYINMIQGKAFFVNFYIFIQSNIIVNVV